METTNKSRDGLNPFVKAVRTVLEAKRNENMEAEDLQSVENADSKSNPDFQAARSSNLSESWFDSWFEICPPRPTRQVDVQTKSKLSNSNCVIANFVQLSRRGNINGMLLFFSLFLSLSLFLFYSISFSLAHFTYHD